MLTSLPNLAFPAMGYRLKEPLSSSYATPRSYPRTDLKTLRQWTSFENDIANSIQTAMASKNIISGTLITVGNTLSKPRPVSNEAGVCTHAELELHPAVQDVLEILGYKGWFALSNSGNIALVGDPDFAWINELSSLHPKLVVGTLPSRALNQILTHPYA
jgi:hypothetical protein